MKIRMILVAMISLSMLLACSDEGKINTNPGNPKSKTDSISYFLGFNVIGSQFAKDSIKINYDYFVKGIMDAMKNDTTFMSKKVLEELGKTFQQDMMAQQEKNRKAEEAKLKTQASTNSKKSEEFLMQNKAKAGVLTTASGMQYSIVKQGNGKVPQMDDMVEFHLRAYDMDGKKFDDTYEKTPIKIGVKDGVKAWQEAFTMMKEGSIYKIFVPPALGWGDQGIPGRVAPGSVVVFEIELIKIEGKIPKQPGGQIPPPQPQIKN